MKMNLDRTLQNLIDRRNRYISILANLNSEISRIQGRKSRTREIVEKHFSAVKLILEGETVSEVARSHGITGPCMNMRLQQFCKLANESAYNDAISPHSKTPKLKFLRDNKHLFLIKPNA